MRIALLVGANPKTFKESARVRLPMGSWMIRAQGIADSKILVSLDSSENSSGVLLENTDPVYIEGGPFTAEITFVERGLENYITVMADSDHGK